LCEAAQTAKRHPDFAASYASIGHRRGKKIATTAIARKLLTRAYHLLSTAAAAEQTAPRTPVPPPRDTPTDREGHQAPGELASSA
jgi:hypothetical protein